MIPVPTKTAAPTAAPTAAKRVRTAPPVDPKEKPDARFLRIARKRLTVAVKAMHRLAQVGKSRARPDGNGAFKTNKDGGTIGYSYTDGQAEKVIQHLTDAVALVKTSFAAKGKASQELIDLG